MQLSQYGFVAIPTLGLRTYAAISSLFVCVAAASSTTVLRILLFLLGLVLSACTLVLYLVAATLVFLLLFAFFKYKIDLRYLALSRERIAIVNSHRQLYNQVSPNSAFFDTASPHFPILENSPPQLASTVRTSNSISLLLALIVKHYVLSWHSKLTGPDAGVSQDFAQSIDVLLRHCLKNIIDRASSVDWPSVFVEKIIPILTRHLQNFDHAIGTSRARTKAVGDDLDLLVAQRYASAAFSQQATERPASRSGTISTPSSMSSSTTPSHVPSSYFSFSTPSHLHPAIDVSSFNTKPAEEAWWRSTIDKLLSYVLPQTEQNSQIVRVIAQEIVVGAIIVPMMDIVSDPHFWNELIDDKAGNALVEQDMVDKLRQALDESEILSTPDLISSETSSKDFDAFLRSIDKCATLAQAKRLRNDVDLGIRRSTIELRRENVESGNSDDKVQALVMHRDRLHAAKRRIGRRVIELGGDDMIEPSFNLNDVEISRTELPSLHPIISNPATLSFWLEFMERRNRSSLIQFWLIVDGMKDPLGTPGDVLSPPQSPTIPLSSEISKNENTIISNDDNPHVYVSAHDQEARADIQMIWESYLQIAKGRSAFSARKEYIDAITGYLQLPDSEILDPATQLEHHSSLVSARKAVSGIQSDIFKEMEHEDFVVFVSDKGGDLYIKTIELLGKADTSSTIQNLQSSPFSKSKHSPRGIDQFQSKKPLHSRSQSYTSVPSFFSPTGGSKTSDVAKPIVDSHHVASFQASKQHKESTQNISPNDNRTTSSKDLNQSLTPHSLQSSSGNKKRKFEKRSMDNLYLLTRGDRTNLIMDPDKPPLFGDDEELEGFSDSESGEDESNAQRPVDENTIEALHDALTSILASGHPDGSIEASGKQANLDIKSTQTSLERSTLSTSSNKQHSPIQDITPGLGPGLVVSHRPIEKRTYGGDIEDWASSDAVRALDSGSKDIGGTDILFADEEDENDDDLTASLQYDLERQRRQLESENESFHYAAPGDLQLPSEIDRISKRIDKLNTQDALIDALIRKAELKGSQTELKVLTKSSDALRQEIRDLKFKKAQLESQAAENTLLPERTRVSISGTTVSQDTVGHEFVLYLIEIHQVSIGVGGSSSSISNSKSDQQSPASVSGWFVTRRYSEFVTLHSKLKERFPQVRNIELPSKRVISSSNNFLIQQRRLGLEKYLRTLVSMPAVCGSTEFRDFLSQMNITLTSSVNDAPGSKRPMRQLTGGNLARSIFRSFASSLDDVLAGPAMMEQIIQRLGQQAIMSTRYGGGAGQTTKNQLSLYDRIDMSSTKTTTASQISSQNLSRSSSRQSSNAQQLVPPRVQVLPPSAAASAPPIAEDTTPSVDGTVSYFASPICNFLIQLFDLNDKNNWLRKQAMIIILQQVLGGTIERRFREAYSSVLEEDNLVGVIEKTTELIFPNGQPRKPRPIVTPAQRHTTREAADRKLAAIFPEMAGHFIGRSNASSAARTIFSIIQNKRLNQHLIYSCIDQVLEQLFPELPNHVQQPTSRRRRNRGY